MIQTRPRLLVTVRAVRYGFNIIYSWIHSETIRKDEDHGNQTIVPNWQQIVHVLAIGRNPLEQAGMMTIG